MFRSSCAIPDPDTNTVIITGGGGFPSYNRDQNYTLVSRYDKNGWLADLPPLKIGRYQHSCTSYVVGEEKVQIITIM